MYTLHLRFEDCELEIQTIENLLIHTHTYIHKHSHIYIWISHTHTQTHTQTNKHTHTHTHTQTHTHIYNRSGWTPCSYAKRKDCRCTQILVLPSAFRMALPRFISQQCTTLLPRALPCLPTVQMLLALWRCSRVLFMGVLLFLYSLTLRDVRLSLSLPLMYAYTSISLVSDIIFFGWAGGPHSSAPGSRAWRHSSVRAIGD